MENGKPSVHSRGEGRELLDGIDLSTMTGSRDRALIGVLVFSFARTNAAISLRVAGYDTQGRRSFFRLREKGGGRYNKGWDSRVSAVRMYSLAGNSSKDGRDAMLCSRSSFVPRHAHT